MELLANGEFRLTAPNSVAATLFMAANGCLSATSAEIKNTNIADLSKTNNGQEESLQLEVQVAVKGFEFAGNTVFTAAELAEQIQPFANKSLTFAQILEARDTITDFYRDKGYITSRAAIRPQTSTDGKVTIEAVEGTLGDVRVSSSGGLSSNYIASRLEAEPDTPLNVDRLAQKLQMLQLDPLIASISAELSAHPLSNETILEVGVKEPPSFNAVVMLDNDRSPSAGSFRRQVRAEQTNLLGMGDRLSLGHSRTDGSNTWDASYLLPLNRHNGSLQFNYSTAASKIVEPPFDRVDIEADSVAYSLSYRQPISRKISNTEIEELALGLRADRRESQTSLLGKNYPLAPGADENGETRISALRFFQDWTKRSDRQVLALRSELSWGLGLFEASVSESEPDGQFLSWRGQGQLTRLLAPDTLLLLRGDLQLAVGSLVPLEQFSLGGSRSVRGYRTDALLADNGANASLELRLPIYKSPGRNTIIQVSPFLDLGAVWNSGGQANPSSSILASTGLGLRLQFGDKLGARLDWGIPLIDVDDSRNRTWQENGFSFSLEANPF